MKKTTMFLLLLFGYNNEFKADTIDFYHVYYNNIQIKKFNFHNVNDSNSVIVLKLDSISDIDKIRVKYYSDNNCINCSTSLQIKNREDELLDEVYLNSKYYSFSIVKLLTSSKNKEQNTPIKVEYNLIDEAERNFGYTLFYIRIE